MRCNCKASHRQRDRQEGGQVSERPPASERSIRKMWWRTMRNLRQVRQSSRRDALRHVLYVEQISKNTSCANPCPHESDLWRLVRANPGGYWALLGWYLDKHYNDMCAIENTLGLTLNKGLMLAIRKLSAWCAERSMKYGNLPRSGMSNYLTGGVWP